MANVIHDLIFASPPAPHSAFTRAIPSIWRSRRIAVSGSEIKARNADHQLAGPARRIDGGIVQHLERQRFPGRSLTPRPPAAASAVRRDPVRRSQRVHTRFAIFPHTVLANTVVQSANRIEDVHVPERS
jgi:hypothetical protein